MTTDQSPTVSNPAALHDPTGFGYSHTVAIPAASELVLVAGQYAADHGGGVTSPDFVAQLDQVFRNLGLALAAHDLGLADVVQLRTYVVDHDLDRLGAIAAAVGERWGSTPPTHTVLGVASLAIPAIQVEIEAVAVRS